MQIFLLLERGADINKKTMDSEGLTPLCLALKIFRHKNKLIIKHFLKNGSDVNATTKEGKTALHTAGHYRDETVRILLDHGADLNIQDKFGSTPFTSSNNVIMMKELAKMRFEGEYICDTNLKYLEFQMKLRERVGINFNSCLEELKKLKDRIIFNSYSLYDILKMRTQTKKLFRLVKNEAFVAAFVQGCDFNLYKWYGEDLKEIFNDAIKRRDMILPEKNKIYESGLGKQFLLPNEITEMIADFATEHLHYE